MISKTIGFRGLAYFQTYPNRGLVRWEHHRSLRLNLSKARRERWEGEHGDRGAPENPTFAARKIPWLYHVGHHTPW